MSDENTGAASSAEPMIPKSRLDELIAERNAERQERQFLQSQLAEVARSRQQVARPEVDTPELEELKQRDPAAYKREKQRIYEIKQLRAGLSIAMDNSDKQAYLLETGEAGRKRMKQVEEIFQFERNQNRNFNVTRISIFNHLRGQDLILREQAQGQTAKAAPVEDGNVPSTDPRSATTITGGTASGSKVEKSREERFKELENVEF